MKIIISKQLKSELENIFDTKEERIAFVKKCMRFFIPIQKISNLMSETTQVNFNLIENGIEIIDPFRLLEGNKKYYFESCSE